MNPQDKTAWGRSLWNLATNGATADVWKQGRCALLDLDSFVVMLRADQPVFAPQRSIPDDAPIQAEILPRPVPRRRTILEAPVSVHMTTDQLSAMREIWERICGVGDKQRVRAFGFHILPGDIPGQTVTVVCGDVIWQLHSANPGAFLPVPKRKGVWKPLPADVEINGMMTV